MLSTVEWSIIQKAAGATLFDYYLMCTFPRKQIENDANRLILEEMAMYSRFSRMILFQDELGRNSSFENHALGRNILKLNPSSI